MSILAPISYGKNIFRGAKKYLSFLLTSHITLWSVSLISTATIFQPPLNALQLLWINVFLDIAAVIAIATGPPIDELLKTQPYNLSDQMLNPKMRIKIIWLSAYQITALLSILFYSEVLLNLPFKWDTASWTEDNNSPSNKTIVFTIIMQSYVLM